MKVMLSVALVLVSILLTDRVAGGDYPSTNLKLELKAIQNKIPVGDILFIQAVLSNQGDKLVKLHDLTGSPFGTLFFEVKGPSMSDFRSVESISQGELSMVPVGVPLKPQEHFVSSEGLLRRDRLHLLFDRPGNYLIRANLDPGEKPLATSEAIKIEVTRTGDSANESYESAAKLVCYGIGLNGILHRHDSGDFVRSVRQLENSNLKHTLGWLAEISRIRDAAHDRERNAPRDALERTRKEAHPYVQDWISLTLASEYIKLHQLDLAKAELAKIKDGNTEKTRALQRIKNVARMLAELRGDPKS